MKILTIVVPSYNSQEYLCRCVDSLLPGGEDVEILIVNDGSTDRTAAIAQQYQDTHAGVVRVIHQPNKGHGGAINTGIREAAGKYIKVVDSDDWVDLQAYQKLLQTLRRFCETNQEVDLLLSNYVYEKQYKRHKKVVRYATVFPEEQVFTWDQIRRLRVDQYILMHSVIYRTQILRDCGLRLPEHCFYVDNLYAYVPLPYVRTLYYLNVDFYRYYIGRQDQSVNEAVMLRRIDQQLFVNRLMVQLVQPEKISNENLREYLIHYLRIITVISSTLLIRSGEPENLEKLRALWAFIEQQAPAIYRRLHRGMVGSILHLPYRAGKMVTNLSYKVARSIVGFN